MREVGCQAGHVNGDLKKDWSRKEKEEKSVPGREKSYANTLR